jgi:uncharacterized protein (DUF1697 family)
MQKYISILRGINVSGHNIIKMDALCKMMEDLNFKNVKTYIQSGNIIFNGNKTKIADLEAKISSKIFDCTGFKVPVIVLETDNLKSILMKNPFADNEKNNASNFYVTFLSEVPNQSEIAKILNEKNGKDEFILSEKVIYLCCPEGYGKTKFSNTFFEKKLKVNATTRNWKTLNELIKIAEKFQ